MVVRPKLDPELREIIEQTRARLAAVGQLRAARGPYKSPFDEETKKAIADFVHSGEYHRLATEIGREDPEVADL